MVEILILIVGNENPLRPTRLPSLSTQRRTSPKALNSLPTPKA